MAFEIRRPSSVPIGIVADRRLYLSRDRATVVEHGSTEAAELLAPPGTVIPAEECARLGLSLVEGKVIQGAEPKAVEREPQSKDEPTGKPTSKGAEKRSARQ